MCHKQILIGLSGTSGLWILGSLENLVGVLLSPGGPVLCKNFLALDLNYFLGQ